MALLFNRGRLGVALRDDQSAQRATIFAWHLLPGRLAFMIAKGDLAIAHGIGKKDTPAIFRHFDVAETRPALRIDRGRSAQIDLTGLEAGRAHLSPPALKARLPLLEGALQAAVFRQIYVVGNPLSVIDRHCHTLRASNSARRPVP